MMAKSLSSFHYELVEAKNNGFSWRISTGSASLPFYKNLDQGRISFSEVENV